MLSRQERRQAAAAWDAAHGLPPGTGPLGRRGPAHRSRCTPEQLRLFGAGVDVRRARELAAEIARDIFTRSPGEPS